RGVQVGAGSIALLVVQIPPLTLPITNVLGSVGWVTNVCTAPSDSFGVVASGKFVIGSGPRSVQEPGDTPRALRRRVAGPAPSRGAVLHARSPTPTSATNRPNPFVAPIVASRGAARSEEHTSE